MFVGLSKKSSGWEFTATERGNATVCALQRNETGTRHQQQEENVFFSRCVAAVREHCVVLRCPCSANSTKKQRVCWATKINVNGSSVVVLSVAAVAALSPSLSVVDLAFIAALCKPRCFPTTGELLLLLSLHGKAQYSSSSSSSFCTAAGTAVSSERGAAAGIRFLDRHGQRQRARSTGV